MSDSTAVAPIRARYVLLRTSSTSSEIGNPGTCGYVKSVLCSLQLYDCHNLYEPLIIINPFRIGRTRVAGDYCSSPIAVG